MERINDSETGGTLSVKLSRRAMLRTFALGMGAVAATSLVGCIAPAAPAASTEAGAATAGAASEPVVLQLWHHLTASDGEVFNALLDQYNAANPDVQIEYQLVPGEELPTKIAAAIATGEPPDIGFRMMSDVSRWNRDGATEPLDELMQAAGLDLNDFLAEYLGLSSLGGKLMMVPIDVSPHGMLINSGQAEEAGLDITKPPADGESLLAWADAMTQRDGDKVTRPGLLLTGSGVAPNVVFGILAQQWGAQRVDAEGKKVTFLETDAPQKAAQWVIDAFDTHKVASRDVSDRYKSFGQGVGSIFWTGPWTLNGYMNTEGLKFMTAKIPTVGDNFTTIVDVAGMNIFSQQDAGRMEASAKAIKWLSDNSLFWVTKGRGVPPRKSILAAPDYSATGIPWEYRQAFSESIEGGFADEMGAPYGPDLAYYAGGDMPTAKAMDPVWAGDRTIEEGLAALVEEWQAVLDRENAA
ncbi:MAG: extracellular solute-binding protein [Caldilineaceae bacterium]